MEIFFDPKTIIPLLIGAALALLGGFFTQFVFWRIGLKHSRDILLIALRAELRVLRDNIGTSLKGYRLSFLNSMTPKPNVFAAPSPVFDANAGNLGQIRDNDLVEHIVEVYSSLHDLRERSASFSGVPNTSIELRDLNEIHMFATATHVQVMKLHNRLLEVPPDGQINQNNTEAESRKLLEEFQNHLDSGNINAILNKRWGDA
jgi:hypothetical protein